MTSQAPDVPPPPAKEPAPEEPATSPAVPKPAHRRVRTNSEPLAPGEGVGVFVKTEFGGILRGFEPEPGFSLVKVFIGTLQGVGLDKVLGMQVAPGAFLTAMIKNELKQLATARGTWIIEPQAGQAPQAPVGPAPAPAGTHPANQGPQALARVQVAQVPASQANPGQPAQVQAPAPIPPGPIASPAQILGAARAMAGKGNEVLVLMQRGVAQALFQVLQERGTTMVHASDLAPIMRALDEALKPGA